MFLKDHLKDTYLKASFEKNYLILENTINRWVHRFGIESLNELIVKEQDQINLIEEDKEREEQDQINLIEEDKEREEQDQINLESLENVQSQIEIEFKSKEIEKTNFIKKNYLETCQSPKNKSEFMDKEKLPLPNINDLRKWINKEKKAS